MWNLYICDTCNFDYVTHTMFCFYWIDFQLNADFPSQFYFFLALLKDRFLKKMLLKRAKIRRLFFAKL